MGNSDLVLVNTNDLREMIQEAVKDAVSECCIPTVSYSDDKTFYTIKDVAQKWGVCQQTMWKYVKEGRIKCARVGRLIRFDKDYIDGLKTLGEVRTPGRTYITKAERNMRKKK